MWQQLVEAPLQTSNRGTRNIGGERVEAGIEQKVVIKIAAFWGASSCTLVHRYNLLSASSGLKAHYHSATMSALPNCTASHPRTSIQTKKRGRRVFGIRGLEEESAGSEWETSLERNMDCTALWHQGETKVGSYRRVLVENNKKVSEELPSLCP